MILILLPSRESPVHIRLEDRGPVFTEPGLYMRASASLPVAVDAFVQVATAEIHRRAKDEA